VTGPLFTPGLPKHAPFNVSFLSECRSLLVNVSVIAIGNGLIFLAI